MYGLLNKGVAVGEASDPHDFNVGTLEAIISVFALLSFLSFVQFSANVYLLQQKYLRLRDKRDKPRYCQKSKA